MYEIGASAANFLVHMADERASELERIARSSSLKGPSNVAARRRLREEARDLHEAIAGINTGKGVTRRGASTT